MTDDPDLAEFAQAQNRQRRGQPCGVARVLTDLDDQRRANLEAALSQPVATLNHKAIADVLEAWDHPVSRNVIQHHRNGGCSCG